MQEEKHEIIEFSPKIPLKIFTHKLGSVPKHWHQSLELLLVLDGTIEISINQESYTLHNDDILLINSNSIHVLNSDGGIMIAVQIDLSRFENFGENLEEIQFECNSSIDNNKNRYTTIKQIIATMIKGNANNNESTEFKNIAISYYLLSQLIEGFKVNKTNNKYNSQKYLTRLTRILNYISDHYNENFTLNQLAAIENLSVPYLSSFFDKYMGMSFSQYYSNVKLDHALEDLLNSSESIETIAVTHGFTEPHAFVRAFKKRYNMLPSIYRKEKTIKTQDERSKLVNYLQLEPDNYLHLLAKYLDSDIASTNIISSTETLFVGEINTLNSIKILKHTFRKFTSVGRASELLNADIRKMLSKLQSDIGYEYIKFHGILSDDMMVCSKDSNGIKYNFTLIDNVLDFLLSIQLKPLIQLSFMPELLAKYPTKKIFFSPFIISPPTDLNEWNSLVYEFLQHLVSRYGLDIIKTWLFSVWNEPDTSETMFGFKEDKEFHDFYKSTYNTVKSISSEIKFGSPSLLPISDSNREWCKTFLSWTLTNNCSPDFLNMHYYSDQFKSTMPQNFVSTSVKASLPYDKSHFNKYISTIKGIFAALGLQNLPVYLTEWNFTVSHKNLVNDTCFKSCYITKNLLENYDSLDSFGYWSLTDLISENALPDTLFHGGMGIYSMNGVEKSVYYAFSFARKLGNELIACGEGYFITKENNRIKIITYHYLHYNNLFAEGEIFDMSHLNRYTPFDMSKKLDIAITLTNLTGCRYQIKEYYVNTEQGSAFDKWLTYGGLPMTNSEYEILSKQSTPGFHQYYCSAPNGQLTYSTQLEPLEIRYTEIIPF
jgi:xylan 1,4-beta-xylosidase